MLTHIRSFCAWLERRLHVVMLCLEICVLVLFFHNLHAIDATSPDFALHAAIAAILGLLMLVTLVKIVSDVTVRNRLRTILRVNMGYEVLIALSTIKFDEPKPSGTAADIIGNNAFQEHFQWATASDGLVAIKRLVPLLEKIGMMTSQIHIRFSDHITRAELAKMNVFVIGGHQNNRIAAKLPPSTLERLQVILRDNKIRLPNNKLLDTVFINNDYVRDFGLVTRMANPFFEAGDGTPCVFWLFEGVRQWGTRTGITLLSNIVTNAGRAKINRYCPELEKNAVAAGPVQFVSKCEASVDRDLDLLSNTEIIFPDEEHRAGSSSLFRRLSRIVASLTAR